MKKLILFATLLLSALSSQAQKMSPQAREHAKLQEYYSREAALLRLEQANLESAKEKLAVAKQNPPKQSRKKRKTERILEQAASIRKSGQK